MRRGYGFGVPKASAIREIATMIVYVCLGGLSLVLASAQSPLLALLLQAVGFILVPFFDYRAALTGDAPPYFARLRAPQMAPDGPR